uniref:Uncharacterized protein n=1 Tax=Anopheles minimus TaxID=112268 RepID=A0A182WQF6_9DIPT
MGRCVQHRKHGTPIDSVFSTLGPVFPHGHTQVANAQPCPSGDMAKTTTCRGTLRAKD